MAARNPHAALENWLWVAIYLGLFMLVLGIAVGRVNPALGWSMAVPGVALVALGIVLIYVRSRLKEKQP